MLSKFAAKAVTLLLFILISFFAKAQLAANFSASPSSGCAPLVVNFADESKGGINQWRWDLGNGTISFLKNPSATYLTPGKYTVKLVVRTAANTEDSIVKTDYINVYSKPTVQFTAPNTSGCYPLSVRFTDQSIAGSGNIASWNWDFGDGESSNQQNPSHIYTAGGNFNVTLQIRNSNGCIATLSKTAFIQISSGALANFTNDVTTSCGSPVTINYNNLSTGTGSLDYQWLFGDGGTSTAVNPSHTYSVKGSYNLQLVVTNSNGCTDTLKRQNAIIVGTVDAAFTFKDSACENTNILFTNTSSPAPSSVLWDFGDGSTSASINPQKSFIKSGIYSVKLISNFGACIDSVIKKVTILANPIAAFIADDTTDCKAPFKVNFTNQSQNAVSYKWNFGDGITDSIFSPSHTYNTVKNFTVELIATSSQGCIISLKKSNYINISKPVIKLDKLPDSSCVPFTKNLSSSIISNDPVTSYLWKTGDGSIYNNASPTHTYNTTGNYTVTLNINTASGCTDSAKLMNAVIVTGKPLVNFSATQRNACAKMEIPFKDETTGGATKWLWRFGDGSTSTLQNPSHKYTDTGSFDVQLIVWNRGCPDSIKYLKYIHIDPPIAKFVVKNDCNKPYERVFTDQSIGADEWLWDFGDGNTSTQKSPIYTYLKAGTFTVSLTVKNNLTGCDFTTTKIIDVINVKADFYASDTIICKGNQISFNTGLSSSSVSLFRWTLGDGSPDVNVTKPILTYTYNNSGVYSVQLRIWDNLNCSNVKVKTAYISVGGPVAKFGSEVPGSCLNSLVKFKDSSISDGKQPIKNWIWNYGDSTEETLTAAPFQHSYNKAGIYTIKLKVVDSIGCTDSFVLSKPITISQPEAGFTSKDTISCPNKTVNFTNESTGPALSFLWNFGDGSTSNTQNPEHTYGSAGKYNITLSITDPYGCKDVMSKTNYIVINKPIPNFKISDSFSSCPPLLIQFTDQSNDAVNTNWDFGDNTTSTINNPSHFYSYPGTYFAKLTVTGTGGCTEVMTKKIVVEGPTGAFTYQPVIGCLPLVVNFTAVNNGKVTYVWDFNDGTTISTTDSVISHTYNDKGAYIPKVILINKSGCEVPIKGKDTIFVNDIKANFNFINKTLCDSGFVSFLDSSISNDIITGYQWNFGDGDSISQKNPVHHYTTTGLFYPSLITITKAGCRDSTTSPNAIKIVASPNININASPNGCTPLTVNFSGIVAVPDTSMLTWKWFLGNGKSSSLQNPAAQVYNTSGVYKIDLVATNTSGCADTASKNIEAYIIPTVIAGKDATICKGSQMILNATGADSYEWTPATDLSCTSCQGPATSTLNTIYYTVKGTTIHSCTAVDSVKITVKQPFEMAYSLPASICKGELKKLTASGANTYEWTPSKSLDNPVSATPTAVPDTTTNYRVVGTDEIGCFKDTGFVLLTVNALPTIYAGIDKTLNVGSSIDLIPTVSPDVTEVIWSPTNGQFRNIYPGITVRPTENVEYTVEVKNNKGCRARDKVSVFVICNNGNVFIPNTFSPNGDGANDIFYPRGTGLFKIKALRIYNRWGEIIFMRESFDANDPNAGWDGTFKGAKLSADVFVYSIDIICSNKSVLTFKGNVALVR